MKVMQVWLALLCSVVISGCGNDLVVMKRLQKLKPATVEVETSASELTLPAESDWQGQYQFAETLWDQDKPLEAIQWYSKCANGGHLPCVRQLGYNYMLGGVAGYDPYLGLELLEQSLDRENPTMFNDMAWFLATSKIKALRDPVKAKAYIDKRQSFGPHDAASLDTLAAVTAALGEFENAARLQQKAITLLLKEADSAQGMLTDYRNRLKLYRNDRIYTE